VRPVYHLVTHLRLGAGRYIVDLAIEQLRRGASVSVCLSDDAEGNWKSDPAMVEELQRAGVDVVIIGDTFHRQIDGLRASSRRLREYAGAWTDDSVAHCHTAMGIVAASWAGAPTVVSTCHGWNPERPEEQNLQDSVAFAFAKDVTSPSTYWAERVNRLAGISNVKVLPYGFDLARYPSLGVRKASRVKRIICLAELTARKGQDVLIAAMPRVWERHPGVELHLAGDGDARAPLQAQAREVDPPGKRIVFRGFIEQPYKILPEFDLMCLPTRSDNQPVSIAEAMLAGVPVVSTMVGGIPEQLAMGDEEAGVCVPPDDVEALASALIAQLDLPRRKHKSLDGIRARFDIRTHAAELESWYRYCPGGKTSESVAASPISRHETCGAVPTTNAS
jgi:glycosyltransferase involved in cell wall biosynthesis